LQLWNGQKDGDNKNVELTDAARRLCLYTPNITSSRVPRSAPCPCKG